VLGTGPPSVVTGDSQLRATGLRAPARLYPPIPLSNPERPAPGAPVMAGPPGECLPVVIAVSHASLCVKGLQNCGQSTEALRFLVPKSPALLPQSPVHFPLGTHLGRSLSRLEHRCLPPPGCRPAAVVVPDLYDFVIPVVTTACSTQRGALPRSKHPRGARVEQGRELFVAQARPPPLEGLGCGHGLAPIGVKSANPAPSCFTIAPRHEAHRLIAPRRPSGPG
jgi:hypothetical protein